MSRPAGATRRRRISCLELGSTAGVVRRRKVPVVCALLVVLGEDECREELNRTRKCAANVFRTCTPCLMEELCTEPEIRRNGHTRNNLGRFPREAKIVYWSV
ncbi:uncharacterized protein LOC119345254 [Triticum dicoccoides]|uniref:uncharacterized protein LOC119345254 n=1 Tax=Triticum dicoccoides TaxID=85692 RepID=UPI00188FB650|nr:uncharacterized protein LOC119345254 [Triticum dicoccoides]